MLCSLAAAAALTLAPAAASADNRYASPNGTGVDPCADAGTPCPIDIAVNQAHSGDDVTLLGGVPPAAPFTSAVTLGFATGSPVTGVTIHGSPGARPVVNFTTGGGEDGFYLGNGSTLRDVVASSTSQATVLIDAIGGTVERVSAHSGGSSDNNYTCVAGHGAVFRDSVCWFSGPADTSGHTNSALAAFNQVSNDAATLRNVTAFAPNANGLLVVSSSTWSMTVTATNIIARGGDMDVRTSNFGGGTAEAANLDHSSYATRVSSGTGVITDPATAGNQTAAPVFVNAANGDFHQSAASTGTLDLGTATGVLPGELDLDGEARSLDAGPDIGADEFSVVSLPGNPVPGINAGNPVPTKKKCKKKKRSASVAKKKCKKKK